MPTRSILFTNNALASRGGSEMYIRDVALALLRRGHRPIAFSLLLGQTADELRRATVPVIDDLARLGSPPDVIHGHHLSPILQTAEASGTVVSGSLAEAVEAFESNLIQDALKTTRGNRARAARLLSTTERIINYKIRRYGIDPRRFRD